MKITIKLNKNTRRRAAGIFNVMLIFGLLFIGCGEYKPDIGAWIDEQIAKARETTEEVPANPEPEPDPTSPEPSPEPTVDAVTEVTEAADSQEIKSALETHAEELELDLTLYDMLSDDVKDEAAQSIFENGPYANKEAIQTAFNDALQAAATAEEDLSKKFKITPEDSTDKAFVEASFNAVHNYIEKIFAEDTTEAMSVIKLGDHIDLKYLNVVGDGGHGYINATSGLRLIVIGINSFNGINGNDTPHVVFHFKDVPGRHKMNNNNVNTTGYYTSAMRTYIVNSFLPGLKNAGVPDEVLWQPKRIVASRGVGASAQTITDELWLPTELEMFGVWSPYGRWSVTAVETAGNQASFTGYYENDNKRQKGLTYWLASPYSGVDTPFCSVTNSGNVTNDSANYAMGCVPAFCVQ
ncbi:MAG: hypothetical protein Ta2F_16850 [Termitinemataceae bacterium]|nr:MAG: hypothetical protein Ta2F_16850 [Termitinemataceae bacterium]